MAFTFKTRDTSRLKKVYPVTRQKPRYNLISDQAVVYEKATITFSNSSGETYTFREEYTTPPPVSLSVTTSDEGLVNVYISTLTTDQITVEASAPFTGTVEINILVVQ